MLTDSLKGAVDAVESWSAHLVHGIEPSYNSNADPVVLFGKMNEAAANGTKVVGDSFAKSFEATDRRIASVTGVDKSIDTLGEANDALENTQWSHWATKGLYENRSREDRQAAEKVASTKESVGNLLGRYGSDTKFSQLEGKDAESVKDYFSPKGETGKDLDQIQQSKSNVREARVRKAMIASGVLDMYTGMQLQNAGKQIQASQMEK